jgi:hypothetical protein
VLALTVLIFGVVVALYAYLIASGSLWVSSEKGGTWPRNASSNTT